jgi:hypothetical protein
MYNEHLFLCMQGALDTKHVHENDDRVHAPSIRLHEDKLEVVKKKRFPRLVEPRFFVQVR